MPSSLWSPKAWRLDRPHSPPLAEGLLTGQHCPTLPSSVHLSRDIPQDHSALSTKSSSFITQTAKPPSLVCLAGLHQVLPTSRISSHEGVTQHNIITDPYITTHLLTTGLAVLLVTSLQWTSWLGSLTPVSSEHSLD